MAEAADAIAARTSGDPVRHAFMGKWPFLTICHRCRYAPSNRRHRLGSRCSSCFRYFPRWELDDSRRCEQCRP